MHPKTDARVTDYILKAPPFAQPVLLHIREVVHKACPGVEESMKWGMPFFTYKGEILCSMAAFKAYCTMGFWKADLLPSQHLLTEKSAMGVFGKITSVKDLPSKSNLAKLVKEAMVLNAQGIKAGRREIPVEATEAPDYMVKALMKNKTAWKHFESFAPGQKKDYVKWITDAKTDATRENRLAQAMEWIAEGKKRNWKYEKK